MRHVATCGPNRVQTAQTKRATRGQRQQGLPGRIHPKSSNLVVRWWQVVPSIQFSIQFQEWNSMSLQCASRVCPRPAVPAPALPLPVSAPRVPVVTGRHNKLTTNLASQPHPDPRQGQASSIYTSIHRIVPSRNSCSCRTNQGEFQFILHSAARARTEQYGTGAHRRQPHNDRQKGHD